MKIEINGEHYDVPASLSKITLGQRIEFDNLYGEEIKESLDYIEAMTDPVDKDLELMICRLDIACKALSHYGSIPLEVVKQTDMKKVLAVYDACFWELFQELDNVELRREHAFNGEVWVLEAPELTYQSDVTFNEFIVSKQIIKQVTDLGNGIWSGVPYLCAIYLRREGEAFSEEFVAEDSDRLRLMMDLPMDIANQVAFFLSISITTYLKTSPSFQAAEEK